MSAGAIFRDPACGPTVGSLTKAHRWSYMRTIHELRRADGTGSEERDVGQGCGGEAHRWGARAKKVLGGDTHCLLHAPSGQMPPEPGPPPHLARMQQSAARSKEKEQSQISYLHRQRAY